MIHHSEQLFSNTLGRLAGTAARGAPLASLRCCQPPSVYVTGCQFGLLVVCTGSVLLCSCCFRSAGHLVALGWRAVVRFQRFVLW